VNARDLEDVQGIILRGYGGLPHARFMLLTIAAGKASGARAFLAGLEPTSTKTTPDDEAINVAFSSRGLERLGLESATLREFDQRFTCGMTGGAVPARLGDVDHNAPDAWDWGGPSQPTVDVIVLAYAKTSELLDARAQALDDASSQSQAFEHVQWLSTRTLPSDGGFFEHFGFRDGIAQPSVRGDQNLEQRPGVLERGPDHNTVEPGEFLLGHPNQRGERAASPAVSRGPVEQLPAADRNRASLGHNGSYLVFRQLEQRVVAFWSALRDNHGDSAAKRRWMAAKLVGRWPNGVPLVVSPDDENGGAYDDDFLFAGRDDSRGMACPIGSHIRRSNPRDSLGDDPDDSLRRTKERRIIRRGRPYGEPVDAGLDPEAMLTSSVEDTGRGLHFLCFNADIARQFEFIQEEWLHNSVFDSVEQEVDPLIGRARQDSGRFTIQGEPRRTLNGIRDFVVVRGGGYFFMPGIAAYKYLTSRLL
jgi:Dyp-type peroxidase family